MLTGKNIVHSKHIATQSDLIALFEKIKEYRPNNKLDKLEIKYEENIITLNEIFYSDRLRSRGPLYFNKSYTTISKIEEKLEIIIEIERPFLSRVQQVIIILLNSIFVAIIISNIYKYLFRLGESRFKTLDLLYIELLLFVLLLIIYHISLKKYTEIINLIEKNI